MECGEGHFNESGNPLAERVTKHNDKTNADTHIFCILSFWYKDVVLWKGAKWLISSSNTPNCSSGNYINELQMESHQAPG